MKIIDVETKRGLVLKGVMHGDASMDTVVVLVTGICSNVFNNKMLSTAGEKLSENNIAYICAQMSDAFSLLHYSNKKENKQVVMGVVFDDFDCVYEDVDAYVQYAKNLGFKKIILAGHSLGSNKIIHYLSKTDDETIKGFIVSSPVDLMHFWSQLEDKKMYLETAQKFVDEGKGRDILPFLFMGFSPMCADTLLGFYNAQNLKNCPVITNEGETESLGKIKVNGAFVIGEKDSMTAGDPRGFIEKINSYTKEPNKNSVIVVPDASHVFYGKHKEYAETILDCAGFTL